MSENETETVARKTRLPCNSTCAKCGSANVKGHWRPELVTLHTPEQITVTCLFCDYEWTVAPVNADGFDPNGEG